MAQFRKLDVFPGNARVGTGVLLRDVQAAATASGQFYAPDPTENTSSIGGNIGANASGSRSFKYGATRRHVQALRIVHLDGSVVEYRRGEKSTSTCRAFPCRAPANTPPAIGSSRAWITSICSSAAKERWAW